MSTFSAYKKRREIAIIGVEATPGVTSTKPYTYRWLTENVRSVPSILENESAMGTNRRVNDSAIDVWHSEGPLGGKVTDNGLAVLMHGMFNKLTTVDNTDDTYTHSFSRDDSIARKSLSYWNVGPSGTRLYNSVYMDNLNFNLEVGDSGAWLEADTAFKGWKHKDVTGVVPLFDQDDKEFTSRHVRVYLADDEAGLLVPATARVKARSITLAFEESVTVDHSVGELEDDPEFDHAPQEAKGTMVVKFKKTDYEDDYFTNKIHAMKIEAINGDSKIVVTGTQVRFREVTRSDGRDDTVTLTISFFFEADSLNGGKDVVVEITNTLAAIV